MSGKRASDRTRGHGGHVAEGVLVGLAVFAFQLPIFDRWFSSMDEGHVLLFSDIIANGGDLYRDATLYPLPGAFYLLAQFFKVFDASILVSRWIVICEFAAFVAMLWVLVRAAVPRTSAFAVVVGLLVYRVWAFPHWQVYSYSTTSLFFILAAVLCQLRYFSTRRMRWLAVGGVLFGVGVYCKQDYGAAALLAMTFALVVESRVQPGGRTAPFARPFALFVGSGAAVGACVGAYFLYHGILADLLQQAVLNHVRGIGAFEYTTYPPLLPLFAQEPAVRDAAGLFAFFPGIVSTVDLETLRQNWWFRETYVYDVALKLFYWGPYAFGAFALVRLWRTRTALADATARVAWSRELILASFAAAFLLLLTLNRPQDFLHLAVLYWPFLCLLGIYFHQGFVRRRVLASILVVALLAPAAAVIGYSGRAYARLREQNTAVIEGAKSGIRAKPAEAMLMREVTAFIHGHATPDETIAVLPYFPILHFLADRRGPDRSGYIVWPFAEFEDRDRRIIDSIEASGTDTVVYNFTQFLTFPPMREFAPDLYAYLVDNFEMERVFSYDNAGFMLAGLVRRTGPEPGVSLLDASWPETAVWVESEDGPPRALPPAERAEFAAREPWPFRRALALRPSSGGERTVFAIPLHVQPGSVLRTAIAVHPERWFVMPAYAAHFRVSVQAGDTRETLFAQTLDPHLVLSDRGWFEVEVPLDAYAGARIELLLSVAVDSAEGESRFMGGFAEPRLLRVEAFDAGVADSPP